MNIADSLVSLVTNNNIGRQIPKIPSFFPKSSMQTLRKGGPGPGLGVAEGEIKLENKRKYTSRIQVENDEYNDNYTNH